jgi:hypothetical protein
MHIGTSRHGKIAWMGMLIAPVNERMSGKERMGR